jgi:hypothetical protein
MWRVAVYILYKQSRTADNGLSTVGEGLTTPHRKNNLLRSVTQPLRRHRCKCEDNIRMDFREVGWEGVDWIRLDQDRDQWRALVNTVMNLLVS